jgi:hypothetical protein
VRGFYFDFLAPARPLVWLRAIALMAGAFALIAAFVYYQAMLMPALNAQRSLLATTLQKQGVAKPASKLKDDELLKAWKQALSVRLQLSLPWATFFREIGQASKSGGDVALISVEPDPVKSNVILIAEARNLNAMLKFVTLLQASPEFSQVALLSHSIDSTSAEKPVRFRMSANWKVVE